MSKEELAVLYRIIVARAKAAQGDIYAEFESRYRDSTSHVLIDELRQRNNEALNLLIPLLDIPMSGK